MAEKIIVNDPLGEHYPWPKTRSTEEERPNLGGSLKPQYAGGRIVVSEVQQDIGAFAKSAEAPTLIGDPRFPAVSAKVSRFNPENEDELTVTLVNLGTAAVEDYRFSLMAPAGREFGANIGVSGSHPYDWFETPTVPHDGGFHITVKRLMPEMRATLDFELVPAPRISPAQALAHAACISEDDAPRAIEILREVGYELVPAGSDPCHE